MGWNNEYPHSSCFSVAIIHRSTKADLRKGFQKGEVHHSEEDIVTVPESLVAGAGNQQITFSSADRKEENKQQVGQGSKSSKPTPVT